MTRRDLLALAASGAFAAEHLNRAPISRESLAVKLPQVEPVKLANGVTILAVEDNRLPIALVRFQIEGAGAIYSPRPGIAELTAEMLKEGAVGRSGKQITAEAARLGATLSTGAAAGAEVAMAEGSGLSGRALEWTDLLASLVLHPTFPADEFTGVRERLIVRSRFRNTQPANIAQDAAYRAIFGSHPAASPAPPPESLATITPEMLAAWHKERYTPGKVVFSYIGRVKPSAFVSHSEKLLGAWKAPDVNATLPPNPQPATARRVILIDRPAAPQTELVIGNLLFERRDPAYFAAAVMNPVLGQGPNSRLYRILRNEKGYVYNISGIYSGSRFPGVWQLRAGTRTDATADTIAIMLEQLRRLCVEPIPAAELDASKRGVVGNFALNLEQPAQVLTQCYLRFRYGFSPDYWDHYPAKMVAVTAGEIQAVAQKYYDPDRALIVAVGDAAKIRPSLEKLGKVELQTA